MNQQNQQHTPAVVDTVIGLLSKGKKNEYIFAPAAAKKLTAYLDKEKDAEKLRESLRSLAYLAYMLENKQHSPDAAHVILTVADAAAASRFNAKPKSKSKGNGKHGKSHGRK